jgi:hypothetical protein
MILVWIETGGASFAGMRPLADVYLGGNPAKGETYSRFSYLTAETGKRSI